jgi:membrane carboxypeptidase/penicillin-binding protein
MRDAWFCGFRPGIVLGLVDAAARFWVGLEIVRGIIG